MSDALVEGVCAYVGAITISIGIGLGFYEFVLRPLGRYLDRRQP